MTIGSRLKEERERIGLTQPEIAQIAGTTKKTQIDYEKGTTSPKADYLVAVSKSGVDLNFVLTGERSGNVSITQPAGRTARQEGGDTFSSKKLAMIKEAAAKYGTDVSDLMGTVFALVDKEPDIQLSQDERELVELFRAASLKLKMQVVNALTSGELPQNSGVSVHGNNNQAAGRDAFK